MINQDRMDEQLAVVERRGAAVPDFTREQIDLIKRTVAQGTDDTELALFLEVARRTGLDPFSRQIYAVMRYDAQAGRKRMTIQTGIDGYFAIAERTGLLAGVDDVVFDCEYVNNGDHPNRATATVYRLVHGVRVPFTYTARWSEYVQNGRDGKPTGMWARMPWTMLGKCATVRALRMGFTAQLSGLYTNEEMNQADSEVPVVTVGERHVNTRTGEIVDAEPPALPAPTQSAPASTPPNVTPLRPAQAAPQQQQPQTAEPPPAPPTPQAQVAAGIRAIQEHNETPATHEEQRELAIALKDYFGADPSGEYKGLRAWLRGKLGRDVSVEDLVDLRNGRFDITHMAAVQINAEITAMAKREQEARHEGRQEGRQTSGAAAASAER